MGGSFEPSTLDFALKHIIPDDGHDRPSGFQPHTITHRHIATSQSLMMQPNSYSYDSFVRTFLDNTDTEIFI